VPRGKTEKVEISTAVKSGHATAGGKALEGGGRKSKYKPLAGETRKKKNKHQKKGKGKNRIMQQIRRKKIPKGASGNVREKKAKAQKQRKAFGRGEVLGGKRQGKRP